MEKNTEMYLRDAAGALATIRQEERRIQALVNRARETGASWTEVGRYLELSKQTAYARYGKPETSKISDADVAGTSVTPSIFSDTPAPAPRKTSRQKAVSTEVENIRKEIQEKAAQRRKEATGNDGPYRTRHAIPNPDSTAQPGIGKGHPHACPNCGSTNHKTEWRNVAEFDADCVPTQYDPPKIAALMQENTK